MRANRLFTLATIGVLMGGTSLAVGQEIRGGAGGSVHGGASVQGGGMQRGGGMGGGTVSQAPRLGGAVESRGSNARDAQGPMRRSEMPGERGSNARSAQGPERGRANAEERGRVEERGRLGANERGRLDQRGRVEERGRLGANERGRLDQRGRVEERGRLGANERGRFDERSRVETTGRASGSTRTDADIGVNLNSEQRTRIHDMVFSRRDIPRVSNLAVDVRVNSVIPRSVRLVTVPEDVVRIYPRFRRHRFFVYNDEIVIVDPVTFRIVAVLPA
jgi:Protein of unknown function (DUF1236)